MGDRYEFISDEAYEERAESFHEHEDGEFNPPFDPWQAGINMGFRMEILHELRRRFEAVKELIDLSYCD
jgi:hypothetical protein